MTPVTIAIVMKADTKDTVHSLSSIKNLLKICYCASELAFNPVKPATLFQLYHLNLFNLPRLIIFTKVNALITLQNIAKLIRCAYKSISRPVPWQPFAPVNTLSRCQGTGWLSPAGTCVPVSWCLSEPGTTWKARYPVSPPAWHLSGFPVALFCKVQIVASCLL
jgi:hypothetical protein